MAEWFAELDPEGKKLRRRDPEAGSALLQARLRAFREREAVKAKGGTGG